MDKSIIFFVGACLAAAGTIVSILSAPSSDTRVLSHAPHVRTSELGSKTDGVALTSRLRMHKVQDHRGSTITRGPGTSKFITVAPND
ncbi:MAG: hypothetical protein AAGM84_15110 [Pseudomonadota bacterium]